MGTERQGDTERKRKIEKRTGGEGRELVGQREKRRVPDLLSSGVECAEGSLAPASCSPGAGAPFSFNQVCFKP